MGWSGHRVNVQLVNIDNMTYFLFAFDTCIFYLDRTDLSKVWRGQRVNVQLVNINNFTFTHSFFREKQTISILGN